MLKRRKLQVHYPQAHYPQAKDGWLFECDLYYICEYLFGIAGSNSPNPILYTQLQSYASSVTIDREIRLMETHKDPTKRILRIIFPNHPTEFLFVRFQDFMCSLAAFSPSIAHDLQRENIPSSSLFYRDLPHLSDLIRGGFVLRSREGPYHFRLPSWTLFIRAIEGVRKTVGLSLRRRKYREAPLDLIKKIKVKTHLPQAFHLADLRSFFPSHRTRDGTLYLKSK